MLHNIQQPDVNLCFLCVVKPVVPRCSVPEAVTVGTSTELRCLENEGFPAPQYRWFHNNEELPQDPKNSAKFGNSSYSINPDTGGLVQKWQASCCCYIYDFIISVPIVCAKYLLRHGSTQYLLLLLLNEQMQTSSPCLSVLFVDRTH